MISTLLLLRRYLATNTPKISISKSITGIFTVLITSYIFNTIKAQYSLCETEDTLITRGGESNQLAKRSGKAFLPLIMIRPLLKRKMKKTDPWKKS